MHPSGLLGSTFQRAFRCGVNRAPGESPGDPRGAWSCCVRNLRGSMAVEPNLGTNNTWGRGASSIPMASYSPPIAWQCGRPNALRNLTPLPFRFFFFPTHLWSPHRQTSPTKHWNYTIYHLIILSPFYDNVWCLVSQSIPRTMFTTYYPGLFGNQTWLAGKTTI